MDDISIANWWEQKVLCVLMLVEVLRRDRRILGSERGAPLPQYLCHFFGSRGCDCFMIDVRGALIFRFEWLCANPCHPSSTYKLKNSVIIDSV